MRSDVTTAHRLGSEVGRKEFRSPAACERHLVPDVNSHTTFNGFMEGPIGVCQRGREGQNRRSGKGRMERQGVDIHVQTSNQRRNTGQSYKYHEVQRLLELANNQILMYKKIVYKLERLSM